jgi:hypothetical protein
LVLVYAKLAVTAGMALFVSTFSTSMIFTVITTVLLFLVGHLQSVAREVWLEWGSQAAWWQQVLLGWVALMVPDMQAYNLIDEIVAGVPVAWPHTLEVLAYSVVYGAVLWVLSALVFENREL